MILIVGLGNPGRAYGLTPHNIGFRTVDTFAERYLPDYPWHADYESEVIKGSVEGKEVTLLKPQTYMNNSGQAVKEAMKWNNIADLESLWIIHDELDLPWGTIRVDTARSSAGHKGVQSVIDHLGSNAFWRLRLGVRPDTSFHQKEDIDTYLTEYPVTAEKGPVEEAIRQKATDLLHEFIIHGIRKTDAKLP